MKNKILLYFVTLLVVVIVFAWIKGDFFGSGDWRISHRPVHPIPVYKTKGMAHLVVEVRSPQGTLEYVLRARQALPKGNGRYLLTEPSMQFFSSGNQSTIIASDMGDVYVNQVGGAMSSHVYPRKGKLFGRPTITMGPVQSFIPGVRKRQPQQMQIQFSRPVSFNYQQGVIKSSGAIHLRSDQADFDGVGLTAQINLPHKKLTYLRIDRGIRLVLRHAYNPGGVATTSAASPLVVGGAPPAKPATGPVVPAKSASPSASASSAPVVYRLDFIDHVKALLGRQQIQAPRFVIYFGTGSAAPPPPTPTKTVAPGPSVAPPPSTAPRVPSNHADDLFLTWNGPMIMRPELPHRTHLLGPKDIFFEARGRVGHPVRLTDGKTLSALAQEMTYQTQPQILKLLAAPGAAVTLKSSHFGTAHCAQLTLNRLTNQVFLAGPGTAARRMPHAATGSDWHATWQKSVDLQLAPSLDSRQPGRSNLELRRAILLGKAQVKSAGLSIQGDELAAWLTASGLAHQPQALQRLLARGHVLVTSQIAAAKGASVKGSRMTCHQLVIQSARLPGHQTLTPQSLVAIGHVHLKLVQTAANRGSVIYRIVTPHLTAALAPSHVQAHHLAHSSVSAQRFTVTRFSAAQGVQLRINNMGRPIVATAAAMSGDRRTGIVHLTGGPAADSSTWATIAQQGNFIAGPNLMLQQKAQSIRARGPGKFVILRKKSANGAVKPGVQILWRKSMRYLGTTHQALFIGHVRAKLLSRPDQQSRLACHQLAILLARPKSTHPDVSDQLRLVDLQASAAAGRRLHALNASFNPRGLLQTRLYLQSNSLHYNALLRRLTVAGPGQMSLEDYRGESSAQRQAAAKTSHANALHQPRGQSAFAWSQSLRYHGATGVLSLRGHVRMVYQPLHPLQAAMFGAVDAAKQAQHPAAPGNARRAGLILLDCQRLMARLTRPRPTQTSAMELGMGGPLKLDFVQAQAAALEIMGIRMTADVMKFNTLEQQAIAVGLNGHEAVVSSNHGQAHGQARKIIWNLKKGRAGLIFIQPRGTISTQ